MCNSSLVYTWCSRCTVPEFGTRWDLMWTHPFFTYASMSGAFLCPSARSKPSCTRAQLVAHEAPVCTARVVLVARQTTADPSLSTYYFHFKMESGRRKSRNYVHSYLSGGRRTAHVPSQCMLVLSQRKWAHFWRRLDTWLTTRLYPRSLEYLAFFGLAYWLVVFKSF